MVWAWVGFIYLFGVLTTAFISFNIFERRKFRFIDLVMTLFIAAFSWFGLIALLRGEDKLYKKEDKKYWDKMK
jgi:hypothetical protein